LLSSFSIDQFAVSNSFISPTVLPLLLINPAFDLLHLYPESALPGISLVFHEMWDTTILDAQLHRLPQGPDFSQ
jgi:hypothetical protein